MSAENIEAKIVFLGQSAVGKTTIVDRGVNHVFDSQIAPTVGASFTTITLQAEGENVNLQIWDTAGQERFRTLAPMYYRGAHIAAIVFSIESEDSFQDAASWIEEVKKETDMDPTYFLIGNKIDLQDSRVIEAQRAEEYAKTINAKYIEVSAKTGTGIEELFISFAEEALKFKQKNAPDGIKLKESSTNADQKKIKLNCC